MPPTEPTTLMRPLIERFERRRPIRAGSLIVTLYGDAIAPRGGSLWLGSLNRLMAPFGVEPGLVRTAMSRLVTDGWFERNRAGRNSYYRLSPHGAAEFAAAGARIYRAAAASWDGRFELAVLIADSAAHRQEARDALDIAGYGQLGPNVRIRPIVAQASGIAPAAAGEGHVFMTADISADHASLRKLAANAWDLDALALAYRDLLADIAPLAHVQDAFAGLADADAFRLRIVLIHEWRRIVLRDPQLPAELLPEAWPGTAAREACRAIYLATRAGCERWIDREAVGEAGPLPPPDRQAAMRFV